MSRLTVLLVVFLLILPPSLSAQDANPPLFLTDSLDPQTNTISLIWADLGTQTHRPITTFNLPSECLPEITSAGQTLLYAPLPQTAERYTYQVNLETGASLPLDYALANNLHCPTINPNGTSIAWLRTNGRQEEVVITRVDGTEPIVLATQPQIIHHIWSPDGKFLLYRVIDPVQTFIRAYSHGEAAVEFWQRDAGLLVDYEWLPNGSALMVAYYTQENLVLGRLDRACLAVGTCYPTPLATFDMSLSLRLTQAISPDNQQIVVALEGKNERGAATSDLYAVNTQVGEAIRLTSTPDLIKTSAVWADDIYFAASRFDPTTYQVTESAIYTLAEIGGAAEVAYAAEGYYPQQILWVK